MSAKICPQCGTRYEGGNRFCTLDGATLVAENPTDTLAGNVLADRYLISKKLGEGGMGEVYLAEHVRMKRKVAVKVMRKALTSDPAAIGRFHREAENASQITHPNVAAVYDFGETSDGLVYLAMEYVDGEALTNVLAREGALNHIRTSDVVSQIADALGAAHALGILHRDLKPDNVMVAKTRAQTDQIKLLDFGIARVMGRDTQHFTSTGLVVGTPEWMSPEQIAGDELTARADIYALGLIAFRALTGVGAFGGATSQEVLLAKMTKSPRRLAEVRPDIPWPDTLQQAMDRVLAIDPALRYDDALIFAAEFYAGVSQLPMTPEAEAYLNQLSQRAVTPVRLGTVEATPVKGVPTLETPARPMPASGASAPQLANTVVMTPGVTSETPGEPVPAEGTTVEGAAEPSVAAPAGEGRRPKRRGPILALVGAAVVVAAVVAITQLGGSGAVTAAAPDSVPATDSAHRDSLPVVAASGSTSTPVSPPAAPAAGSEATRSPATASRPATPALDSAAARNRASIFTVIAGRTRGAGFLADTSGLVLTSSTVVGDASTVDVFLDGGRRVLGRVAMVDSAKGLAGVLIPRKYCPSACAPVTLAADRASVNQGDSVMAVMPQTLVSQGARVKGSVTNATTQRLAASMSLAGSGAGAPVFTTDGAILGLARAGGGRSTALVPASVARAFMRTARAAGVTPIDSLPPSWPSRPVSTEEMAAAVRRTSQDLEQFRVKRGDFDALVMTPQVMAYRMAEADSLRKYFNPGSPATQYCDGNGPCDPLEAWANLDTYLSERRAVVVIQAAPAALSPPQRGERARVNMRGKPVLTRMELVRGGKPAVPIEAQRIYSVINPAAYEESQRESLYAGLYVFDPVDLLLSNGQPELRIWVLGGRDPIRIPIPASVVEAVRKDLASALR